MPVSHTDTTMLAVFSHTPYFPSLVTFLLEKALEEGLLGEMNIREVSLISRLALLHDVGKLMIPQEILNKPEPLSEEELVQMKNHPVLGERIIELLVPDLRGSASYAYAREICRRHHERWDGKGYPDGLRGDEIPPYVQVISLADAFDALLASRSYRPPLAPEQAARMILSGECGVFSPWMLQLFKDHLSEIKGAVQTRCSVNSNILFTVGGAR